MRVYESLAEARRAGVRLLPGAPVQTHDGRILRLGELPRTDGKHALVLVRMREEEASV